MSQKETKRKFYFGLGEAGAEARTRKPGIQMIIGFTSMIIIMMVLMLLIMNLKINSVIQERTTELVDSLNKQTANTIELIMDRIERNVNMIFSNELYYKYDPTNSLASEDEVIEAKLASDLATYATMEDYLDFCVVYPYGHTVGQLSDKTWNGHGMQLYDDVAAILNISNECWASGLGGDYSILYYFHRLNNNALIIASIKMDRISSILTTDTAGLELDTYLVNNSLVVQATTADPSEVGSYIKSGIYRLVSRDNKAKSSRLYLACSAKIDCDWLVVSAIPYSNLTNQLHSARMFILGISIALVIFATIFTIWMTRRILMAVNQTVGKLDVKSQRDLLTGLLNKVSFEEIVGLTLEENYDNNRYALVFMDVDNFKGVNDRCGHDVGDEVLRSFSQTIDSVFRAEDIKGRLGGDEFCVLMKLPYGSTEEEIKTAINDVCGRFKDALHRKAATGRQSMPAVTSSMGAAINNEHDSFDDIYHRADTALYQSKHKGKDTWSIYGE